MPQKAISQEEDRPKISTVGSQKFLRFLFNPLFRLPAGLVESRNSYGFVRNRTESLRFDTSSVLVSVLIRTYPYSSVLPAGAMPAEGYAPRGSIFR